MWAPRFMLAPARLGRTARDRRALRRSVAAGRCCSSLCNPQAGRRRVHPRRLCRRGNHDLGPSGALRERSSAQEHPGRRRNVERQDDADKRAAGRSRKDLGSGRSDRGHARASVQGAESRGVANQGRRDLAFGPCALVASPATRPHSDRRGARGRGSRPAQGLGHRPSRRHRHHPCRHRARRLAPARAAHPGSRRHGAARPDRRDHQRHRRSFRPRCRSSSCRTRSASPGSGLPATTASQH